MINLDDQQVHERLDKDDMYHKIIHQPEQIFLAWNEAVIHGQVSTDSVIKRVIVCGMGGSAISGDILKAALFPDINVEVVKDYHPPKADENTLAIFCSYSGNTEETLACWGVLKSQTPHLAAVTTGGKLRSHFLDKHLWLELTPGMPPRSAIGYLFFSIYKIVHLYGLAPQAPHEVAALMGQLTAKAGAICQRSPLGGNLVKDAAQTINGKIPIFYAINPSLAPVAYRAKCQINENAKYPAFCHTFPEMNHNEIEAWETPLFKDNFVVVLLNELRDDARYAKRRQAFIELLARHQVPWLEFFAEGATVVERIFSLIYPLDMLSYYLAIAQDTDPTVINYINYLKEYLEKN